MKLFRILFLVFFVTFSFSMFSQESVNLNWETKNIKGNNIVSFDAAVYLEHNHGLPSFKVIFRVLESAYSQPLASNGSRPPPFFTSSTKAS